MTTTALTVEAVRERLRCLDDPEVGLNVVDLGLVHELVVTGGRVHVEFLLTTPGCPMHDVIGSGAEALLSAMPGVEAVTVAFRPDLPWDASRISEAGLAYLNELRGDG